MLAWSLKLFRVRGIQLSVHFSFFLLLAFIAWQGWTEGAASLVAAAEGAQQVPDPAAVTSAAWEGVFWNVIVFLACFTCVVLHEFGHCFTAMYFGVGVRRILLLPIGGMAEFDSIPRQPARELLITLAGPAVNFVLAAILALFVGVPSGMPFHPEFPEDSRWFWQLLLYWNLLMGCFNLLPIFPMDGGRILRALLAMRQSYLRATWIAATVGKVLAVAAALVAMFVFHRALPVVLFAFIFFAGELEYRAIQRRELEDAHWRAVLARMHHYPPPAEEPPVLLR
jgi:Zn-dependent protease